MHAAAEAERATVLERSRVDAHAFAEQVQIRSAEEAAVLKRNADDDVASIREWSKAEIARVREETERRIAGRRHELDDQLDRHAASIERRLESVRRRVEVFEAEMTRFFEQLLEEQDPTLFAQLAASLPEPPSFEELEFEADLADEMAESTLDEVDGELTIGDETSHVAVAEPELLAPAEPEPAQPDAELELAQAIAAAPDEPADNTEIGSTSGFAEAEAAAAADAAENGGGAVDASDPDNSDEAGAAWAARLAGLIGYGHTPAVEAPAQEETAPSAQPQTTQVIVVGLVSVASIAGFKRQLGHMPGVVSVGVSSGPDGEFVFRVTHSSDLVVRDAVPTIPGFQARIVSSGPGIVHVSARDPEAES